MKPKVLHEMQKLFKKLHCAITLQVHVLTSVLQGGVIIKDTSLPSIEIQKLVKLQICWEDDSLEKLSIQL